MSVNRGGLGRGLGALIRGAQSGLREVPLDHIRPNPRQPRQRMDPEELAALSESIREHGLLQPLVVTGVPGEDGHYLLIAGERRWQAARMAGLERVPALVREAVPEQMLALALVENIQRSDLNPLEEAAAFRQLIDEFGLTQEEVARRVGRSRVAVANTLRLLQLPDAVRQALADRVITEGHARAILGAETEAEMLLVLEAVKSQQLSVRETEELIRRQKAQPATAERESSTPESPSPNTQAIEDALRAALGTRVKLFRSAKGGRLVIHFYSEEQLSGLYDLLTSVNR